MLRGRLSNFCFSNCCSLARIGLLVLVAHDFSDIFLELGKTYLYKKDEIKKIVCFALLTISWMVTRLWVFPAHIIGSILYEAPVFVPVDFFALLWVAFIAFLSVLFLMHVYWFYLILRILYKKLLLGKAVDDDRESDGEKDD
jgi:hypothetical protein